MASRVAQRVTPGITYQVRDAIYVQLTEKARGTTLLASRGPGFTMPATSGFKPLAAFHPEKEPSASDVISAIESAFAAGYDTGAAASHEGDLKGLTFAGGGDPLERLDTLCEVSSYVRYARPGTPIIVNTLGLIPSSEQPDIIQKLVDSGVERVSVLLNASNPMEYKKIMKPEDGLSFQDVCAFIANCKDAGIATTATAAENKKVSMPSVRALANSLGADFKSRSYHA